MGKTKNKKIIKKVTEKFGIKKPINIHIVPEAPVEINQEEELYKLASYQTPQNCNHTSCLGKNLYISKNQEISFCPKHIKESKLGTIENITNKEKFENALKEMIEKRNKCKQKCEIYEICQGGCVFEKNCEEYKKNQQKVIKELNQIMENKVDLGTLPKYKEKAVINLIFKRKE